MSETMIDPAPGRTERYSRWVIRNRWWVVLSTLLVTMASVAGLLKLGLGNDYRVFFSEDNPDLNAFEAVENIYTKNDNVLFIVKPREGEVFTAANLEVIRSLTEDAWQPPAPTFSPMPPDTGITGTMGTPPPGYDEQRSQMRELRTQVNRGQRARGGRAGRTGFRDRGQGLSGPRAQRGGRPLRPGAFGPSGSFGPRLRR